MQNDTLRRSKKFGAPKNLERLRVSSSAAGRDEVAGSSGGGGRRRAAADAGCHQSRYRPAVAADGKADSTSISFSCAPCETSQPGKWTCAGA